MILNNIQGYFKEGTLTSILGPSGSGKTTLLNFLSNRLVSKNLQVSGNIKINNQKSIIGYVQQDDILFPYFTPLETFEFIAMLKLDLKDKERESFIKNLIDQLSLNSCQNTMVLEKVNSRISKSERKRISIGIELLSNPSLLFLDEPTTGLDSVTSYNIVSILGSIAKSGRTVITTLHQPSSNLFNIFDQLLLLVEGNIIYQGNSKESTEYFANIGFPCKMFMNPADFFMNVMNPEGMMLEKLREEMKSGQKKTDINRQFVAEEFTKRITLFREKYEESQQLKSIKAQIAQQNEKAEKIDLNKQKIFQKQSPFLIQLWFLIKRNVKDYLKKQFMISLFNQIFMGLVIIIVFTGLGTGRKGIMSRHGLWFMVASNIHIYGVVDIGSRTFYEINLFLRETQGKVYKPSAYFLSKQISFLPFEIIILLISYSIYYNALELRYETFWKIFVIINFQYQAAQSFGSFLANIVPNMSMLAILIPILVIPFMLLSGGQVNLDTVPKVLYPIQYLSMVKYGFTGYMITAFEDMTKKELIDNMNCKYNPDNICDPLKEYNFKETVNECLVALSCIIVGFRFLSFLLLKRKIRPPKIKIATSKKQ